MEAQIETVEELKKEIDKISKQLDIKKLEDGYQVLQAESRTPDFWQDQKEAQEIMKRLASMEARIKPWQEIRQKINEVSELISLNDESMTNELDQDLARIKDLVSEQKQLLKFNGPYDEYDALVSIYAGAGGTDAQDWTQMLLRMYVRWADKNNYSVDIIQESPGEEAGIKSVTIEIDGEFIYGMLKGEHGVHRLVRLSPFNSDNLRQTSFARVEVLPKINRPDTIVLDDKDLKTDVFRSGGHGGQSVNTTDSAVRVTHISTGIVVTIQNERSQLQNKETALTILRSRLAQLQIEQHELNVKSLKGSSHSADWGNQIRSYVLHPYKQVKDLRTGHESKDPEAVLDGDITDFINAYLEQNLSS